MQKVLDIEDLEEAERGTEADEGVQKQPAGKHRSRTQDMPPKVIGSTRKDLASDLNTHGATPVANIVPKTPRECVLQAQTYLMAMNPTADDPRHGLHNDILQGLSLAREKLSQNDTP